MASKKLKKVLKAALIGGAGLLAAKGLGKRRLSKAVSGTDDAGIGVSHFKDYITNKPKWKMPDDPMKHQWPNVGLGSKHGGRISKKGGGRTGKQFGGGLNRRVARPIGGVGAPVRPMPYKHGGSVKSRGVAKRGGGAEIK